MNKPQKNFMLEIVLNVIFLSFGLFIAFYLLLHAQSIHQENLALSKLQAEMMNLSETLTSDSNLSALSYDINGQRTNNHPSYIIYLKKINQDNFEWINLRLVDKDDQEISSWDVGISQ